MNSGLRSSAGALAWLFALGLLWLTARWLFAVPLLILGNLRPIEALRMTWRATRGDSIGLVRVFGLWWTGVAILSATLSALGWFLVKPLFVGQVTFPDGSWLLWPWSCDSICRRDGDRSGGVGRSPIHGDAHEPAAPAPNTEARLFG